MILERTLMSRYCFYGKYFHHKKSNILEYNSMGGFSCYRVSFMYTRYWHGNTDTLFLNKMHTFIHMLPPVIDKWFLIPNVINGCGRHVPKDHNKELS